MKCKSCKDVVDQVWYGKCEDCWTEESSDL